MSVEHCDECGWAHADVAGCWRKTLREAREKLADPTLPTDLRGALQSAVDRFEQDRRETVAFLRALSAESEQQTLDQMEAALSVTESVSPVPVPGECHPAYADRREWIIQWFTDNPGQDVIRLPVPQRASWLATDAAATYPTAALPVETLRRRRCAGQAPYVGRPFHYAWFVAEDTYKRWVASEAVLTYH